MNGVIVNYRLGKHTQRPNYMVVKADGSKDKDAAAKLIGKSVVWKSSAGKEIKGKVTGAHGKNGAVKVLFEKGMPGQSIAGSVEIK